MQGLKLEPLPVVSRAVSSSPPVSVDWRGLEPDDAIGDVDERYLEDFRGIDSVAAVAYIICCSEWLYYFLRHNFKPLETANFEQFIIANWVWVCDLPRKFLPKYDLTVVEVLEIRPENVVALEFVTESISAGIRSVPRQKTYLYAGRVGQMCDSILPEKCGYTKWRADVLKRLNEKFPANQLNPDLVRISRRFFDTDVNLDDIDHETDCESFLGYADTIENPYLPLAELEPD